MNFKSKKQAVIGLTGGMLSGKSTALKILKECGAFTLSCDELVREISSRPSVKKKIENLLGGAEPSFVAQKIFNHSKARKQLEKLLHPLVLAEIAKRLKADKAWLRVVEVPLLFEVGWESYFDFTVAVLSSSKNLQNRLTERGVKKSDFLKRVSAQFPQEKKASLADICLINDGSLPEFTEKVQKLYHAFHTIYQVKERRHHVRKNLAGKTC